MALQNDAKIMESISEDWDDYMSAKKSKLEQQFKLEAQLSGVKKNIFDGISIFVNGYSIPSADELKNLMMDYGGIYHHYYKNGKTTYMIASNLPYVKIQQYKDKAIKIIKPSWVVDCIKAGKMLDYKPYLLLNDFNKDQGTLSNFSKSHTETNIVDSTESTANYHPNPSATPVTKTARDENFLEEFYNNSRLHLISTLGATFKQYVNELRSKDVKEFPGKESLRNWKMQNPSHESHLLGDTCVMHIDMDCFFVSVGLRKRPELRDQPVAVTHARGNKTARDNSANRKAEFELHEKRYKEKYKDNENFEPWYCDIGASDSMSEIASCNYEARKCGVKNGMLLGQAFKLCPNLKPIPYDFDDYKEVAYALYNHVARYTLDIEAVSCDEMFVDCTSLLSYANVSPLEFASIIRKEIKEITGCPCSTGFGQNRLLARLATKKAKPAGQYQVKPENAASFIRDFNVSDLPGVGSSISMKLSGMGVKTCKDLQNLSLSQLQSEFGNKLGLNLHRSSFGEDDRPLNFCHQRKSVSAEVNYGIRFQNHDEAKTFLKKLATEVESRLNSVAMQGKSITLKLMVKAVDAPAETAKFMGHGICNYITKTVSLFNATCDSLEIYRETLKIFQNLKIIPADLRGIGIQISRLEPKSKSASKASERIDAYVIRKKTPVKLENENDNPTPSTSSGAEKRALFTDEIPSTSDESSVPKFNESEYDVSLSQIDTNYLAALPDDIKAEIMQNGLRKRKRKANKNIAFGPKNLNFNEAYIIVEGDVKKLNPVISPIEMKDAISDWLSKEKAPEECDVRMLSDYLQQLMKNGQFESINFVVDHFQKLVVNKNVTEEWKQAYQYVTDVVKEAMKSNYFNVFK